MTIELETRILGIPIKREPPRAGTILKPKNASGLRGYQLERGIGYVINPDDFGVERDVRVIQAAVDGGRPKVVSISEKFIFNKDEINEAKFRIPGRRFPGVTRRLVWKPTQE